MENILIKCPFSRLKDDYFVYLDVVAKDGVRSLDRKEVFFLLSNCTKCNSNKKIEITEEGGIKGCPALEKYKENPERLGFAAFIRQEESFIKKILAKEFNFILLKEKLVGIKSNPTLEELFPYIKKYKKQQSKEQS